MQSDIGRRPLLRELQTMQSLIHTVLCLVRDNGSDMATKGAVRADLPSLVQTICDDYADAGHSIELRAPAHLEIDCDPDQLMRAVTNLIDNALKYAGSVTIRILSSADDQSVMVEVQDDGPGIPDSEKVHVFEPFYRSDAARTSNGTNSFGLGLSIAQAIVHAHAGKLVLSDAEPHGLIACIRLPRTRGWPQTTKPLTSHAPAAIGR